MMATCRNFLLFIFLFFQTSSNYAQNEVQFKAMIDGDIKKIKSTLNRKDKLFRAFSNYYKIDLNGDGYYEGIAIEESDLGSSIHFFRNYYEYFQELPISSGGSYSKVERIELKRISQTENVILVYFSEGLTKYLSTRSRHRLYAIYIPENLFKKPFVLSEGPVIFEEFESKGHYHVSQMDVRVEDLDLDGTSEIVIQTDAREMIMILNRKKQEFGLL